MTDIRILQMLDQACQGDFEIQWCSVSGDADQ
ncbi:hypothetical protein GGQ66_000960 [Rhizobium borbori]|uniref:Uncharacterized protein n=1 Tax=Allorhizobium borbori TaxID=485907 RepID=A0A7W6K1K9_9HYPH|nr:hypothetical protein [Allorhizobium borbori]